MAVPPIAARDGEGDPQEPRPRPSGCHRVYFSSTWSATRQVNENARAIPPFWTSSALMAIKILAVQIWAFCALASWSGQGAAIRVPGPSALLTRKLLALVGMPH